MIHIELTQEEQQLLTSILEEQLSDLRMEIVDTDSLGYKEMLKGQKRILAHLLEKVQPIKEAIPS